LSVTILVALQFLQALEASEGAPFLTFITSLHQKAYKWTICRIVQSSSGTCRNEVRCTAEWEHGAYRLEMHSRIWALTHHLIHSDPGAKVIVCSNPFNSGTHML